MTVAGMEAATGASARGLRAIMNALVGLGLLTKTDGDRYDLTPESAAFLVSGQPGYLGGLIRHGSGQLIPKWLDLYDIVATGRPSRAVNREDVGADFFHHFVEDLFPMNYPAARALAAELALGDGEMSILDLAAGSGVWSVALVQSAAGARATVVDWPEVLPVTRKVVERHGLTGRYDFVGGDLLAADFGGGHRVATLGHILHSEGEERGRALLAKTHEALAPGGTIAIAEFLVDDDRTAPPMGLLFAVNMLVNTQDGDTYSFEEISGWLTEAGFRDCRQLEVPGPSPLILATKR
jgi:hypothetical protein